MRRHIEPLVDRDVPFRKMTPPSFPSGMRYKMLSIDGDTGASTMTVPLDGGYKQPPSLRRTDMELLVLAGSFTLGSRTCRPGFYAFVPRGVSIPALQTQRGCQLLLMYNQAEPQLLESDADEAGASRAGLIEVHSFDDIPWMVPTFFPATAPGCLIKLLRFDEQTHALSVLDSMTPGFWQDNISYHDCADEPAGWGPG